MPSRRERSHSPSEKRERPRDREYSAKDRRKDRERTRSEDRYADRESKRSGRRDEDEYRDSGSSRKRKGEKRDTDENKFREDDSRRRRHERENDEDSDEDLLDLRAMGVKEINEDDYFLKSSEFKLWLKEERGRYLDEMSSESAHKYFRKFVRRWNDGALKEIYYRSQSGLNMPSSSNSAYKWSFAANRAKVDDAALAAARAEVDRFTHSASVAESSEPIGPTLPSLPGPSTSIKPLGPFLPSAPDRQLAIEDQKDARKAAKRAYHKDQYRKADEAVPRNIGKEGELEEKRASNTVNKEFREKEVGGLEVDEGTLMGDPGGFAAALRTRDAAKNRREDHRAVEMASRRAADEERLTERRQKESTTMEMFKAMARERFG